MEELKNNRANKKRKKREVYTWLIPNRIEDIAEKKRRTRCCEKGNRAEERRVVMCEGKIF